MTTEAPEILIGLRDADHVLLRNWRHDREEWTYADADIRCGPWHGQLKVAFYSDEVARFSEAIQRLYRDLSGTATLHPIEPYLKLTLVGNGRGGVDVLGSAQSEFGNDTHLSFCFSIDQTFLPRIADGLMANSSR